MSSAVESAPKKGTMSVGRAWAVVVVVFLAGFCMPANMGQTMWLAPVIMQTFGFGENVLGILNGCFYILGALIAFPAASFVRKIGVRKSVCIALACGIVGNLIGALVIPMLSVPLLMVGRFIQGAGFGLMGVIGVVAITPWFPKERRGAPLGFWGMWVAVANSITPLVNTAVFGKTGSLESVWWLYFIIDIVVLIAFLIVYRDPSDPYIDEAEKSGEAKFSYKELFGNKVVWMLAALFFIEEGAFIASQGFLSAYIHSQMNASLVIASAFITGGALWGAIFSPISGKISDAIGSRYKILVFCMISAVLFGLIAFWVTDWRIYIIVVILNGITGGGVAAMLWASCSEVVPSHLISGATAALACSQSVGMFIGSTFFGGVVASLGYTMAGWVVLVPCFGIGLLIAAFGLRGKLR